MATTYHINYKKGQYATGGSEISSYVLAGNSTTTASNRFTRDGYTQDGWSVYSDGRERRYAAGISITPTGDMNLFPYWVANTYTVTYKPGSNGTGSQRTATKAYGTALTLLGATFTRSGYTQTGWSTSDGGAKAYDVGGSYTANAAVTLYPYWTANTYTVTFNANGGSVSPTSKSVTYASTYGTLPTPTRTGYTFDGWFTASSGGTQITSSTTVSITANQTLYAHWTATVSTFTVSPSSIAANGSTQGTVTITSYSGSYTHKVEITLGTRTQTFNNVAASQTFTIPAAWCDQITEATSATATVKVTTYSDSTALGSTSKTFTITVPSSVVPSATITKEIKGNSTVIGWGVHVQGYSYPKFTISASGVYSSTVKSISINGEGISKSVNANSLTVDGAIFSTTGSKTYTIIVTDSRNRTKTYTETLTVYEYFKPSFNDLTAYRSNSSGTLDEEAGEYLTVTASQFVFASCNSNNVITVVYKYKESTVSSYTNITTDAVAGTKYTRSASSEKNYNVQVVITDSLNNSQTVNLEVASIDISLCLGLLNDRARFGGVPRQAGLEVDWDAQFDGTVDIVPRRCSASLSSAGWYRVLTFAASSANDSNGYAGSLLEINIGHYGSDSETHIIRFHIVNGKLAFSDENSCSYSQKIDKIRYTRNGSIGYIDIHATSSVSNVYADFVAHDRYSRQNMYFANALESVADAPSGETVLTTYTFAANTLAPSIGQYSESITSFSTVSGLGNYYHAFMNIASNINIKPRNVLAVFTDWGEGSNSVTGFTVQGNSHLYVSFVNNTACTVYITYLK